MSIATVASLVLGDATLCPAVGAAANVLMSSHFGQRKVTNVVGGSAASPLDVDAPRSRAAVVVHVDASSSASGGSGRKRSCSPAIVLSDGDDDVEVVEEPPSKQVRNGAARPPPLAPSTTWTCSFCTRENPSSAVLCASCEQRLQPGLTLGPPGPDRQKLLHQITHGEFRRAVTAIAAMAFTAEKMHSEVDRLAREHKITSPAASKTPAQEPVRSARAFSAGSSTAVEQPKSSPTSARRPEGVTRMKSILEKNGFRSASDADIEAALEAENDNVSLAIARIRQADLEGRSRAAQADPARLPPAPPPPPPPQAPSQSAKADWAEAAVAGGRSGEAPDELQRMLQKSKSESLPALRAKLEEKTAALEVSEAARAAAEAARAEALAAQVEAERAKAAGEAREENLRAEIRRLREVARRSVVVTAIASGSGGVAAADDTAVNLATRTAETQVQAGDEGEILPEKINWACCSRCNKWRRVVSLPGEDAWWECSMNTVPLTSSCDAPEDEDEDDAGPAAAPAAAPTAAPAAAPTAPEAAESAEAHALSHALEAAAAAGMRLAQLRRPRECFGRYALVFEEYIGSLRETLKASFSTDTTWILGKGKGEKGVERGSELAAWEAAVGTSAFKKGVFRNSLRTRLLSRTHVSYAGDEREAQDLNGVSAEFFSAVWTQLFASVVGAGDEPDDDTAPRDQREWPLFERGGDEGRLLPYLPPAGRANAAAWCATEAGQRHLTRLRLAGTALLKCLLDGYS